MKSPEDMRTVPAHGNDTNAVRGVLYMTLTAVLFAATALLVGMAARTVKPFELVLVRYSTMIVTLLALRLTGVITVRAVNRRLLVWRSVAAAFSGAFYFLALATISIAEATMLRFTYPVFAIATSALLFRERTERTVFATLALSLTGVVILVNPFDFQPQIGYAWGLLNALAAGISVGLVRKLRVTDTPSTALFWWSVTGFIFFSPLFLTIEVMPDPRGVAFAVAGSLAGLMSQTTMLRGFKYAKTGVACVLMMMEVALATLGGIVFLGQVPSPVKLIGGAFIIAGGVLVMLSENKKRIDRNREMIRKESS